MNETNNTDFSLESPELNHENTKTDPHNKRYYRKRLTTVIDRVVEDLNCLEVNSPKSVTKEMTTTFRKIGSITEEIKKKDLDPNTFHANRAYRMTKDKINAYINGKYKNQPLKDSKRMLEILQNRPLTTFYKPEKLLFESFNESQIHEVLSNNKRKFGEFWNMNPKTNEPNRVLELPPIEKIPKASKESRNAQLSSLIKKLMEKNLGMKIFENRKDHKKEIIRTSFDRKKKPVHTKENTNNDEEIVLLDEKDYLAPEYEAYISNFSNRLLIDKYISKNNERRRRVTRQLAKLSKY